VPREAHVGGSAVGTIVGTYFELRAYGRRQAHPSNPSEEIRDGEERGAPIGRGLGPLADRVRAYVDDLRRVEPWSRLLQTVEIEAQEPGVRLRMFEQLEYREILREVQQRGAYAYSTSFPHHLGDTHLTVELRFVLKGWVSVATLYELEDALHQLRSPLPREAHHRAHAGGVVVHATECRGHEGLVEAIRGELTQRLEERQLCCEGDDPEGSRFAADLDGPDLFHARLELAIAGEHKWARTKLAVLEAVRACAPEGVTEYPAPEIPWRLVAAPLGR
jgi:hypothetical protein